MEKTGLKKKLSQILKNYSRKMQEENRSTCLWFAYEPQKPVKKSK